MKIGILTFHCVNNYGATLQGYALSNHISQMGHQVSFVDYSPSYLVDKYIPFSKERMRNSGNNKFIFLVKELIKFKGVKEKNNLFSAFRDSKFELTKLSDVADLDFVVLGSDQIWNTKLTNGVDEYFFGGFVKGPKYISYAASMEAKIKENEKEIIKDKLKELSNIGVREESLARLIKEIYEINTTVVVDPVFLLDKDTWINFSKSYNVKQPYVFVYYFGLTDDVLASIKNFASQRNLRVILTSVTLLMKKEAVNDVSPEQFVWLVANADFVFTNSFHGTSFSLLMETPFVSVKKINSNNERISNILTKANQISRLVGKEDLDNLDYNNLMSQPLIDNTELSENIRSSKAYLTQSF
jgi:hypothetical protein